MAQHLKFLLAFVLMCAVQAQAGNVTVINMGSSTRSFKVWRDGSLVGQPLGWQNIPPGASGISSQPDGMCIQAQAANAPDDFCYPTTGVSGSGGTLIYMGTNDCVVIEQPVTVRNTTAQWKQVVFKINGYEEAAAEQGAMRVVLAPSGDPSGGDSWSWTFDVGVCKDGSFDRVTTELRDYYGTIDMDEDGAHVNVTNRDVVIGAVPLSATNVIYGGTNFVVVTNGLISGAKQRTNYIDFTGLPSGAAQDSTLQAGFGVLGQEIRGLGGKLDLLTAATLQGGGGGGGGDGLSDSGITNAIRGFHFDNTNLLGEILAKFDGGTNSAGTNAQAGVDAAEDVRDQFAGLADGAPSSFDEPGSELGAGWTLSVPLIGSSVELDLNPFSRAWVFDLAGLCRRIVTWGVLFTLLWRNTKVTLEAIMATGGFRQATSAGTTVLGTNVNSGLALAMAAAITVAVGVVPSALVTWAGATGHLPTIFSSPFTASTSGIQQALWMANQFLPLALILTAAISAWVYQISLGGLLWVSQTVVRFLVG